MKFLLPGSTMGPVGVGLTEAEVLVDVASSTEVVWAVVETTGVVLASSSVDDEDAEDVLLLELWAEVVCSSTTGTELVGVSTAVVLTTGGVVVSTELEDSEPPPNLYS